MNIKRFKGYFFNLILIWATVIIYNTLPFYQNFLQKTTKTTILILALTYTIGALIYYIFTKKKIHKTKGELIFSLVKKLFLKLNQNKKPVYIERNEKIALLFILVKIFFLPIMINFVLANFAAVKGQLPNLIKNNLFSLKSFNIIVFPFLLAFLFLIDTLWFAFGYATEAKFLKNKIRSVEPTIFGWAVALICYPPFNSYFTGLVGWYANDYAIFFGSDLITFFARILCIILIGIYVSATLALGTKASNLTNRGIVTKFPYSIIRHPAYISKNLVWWITIIPVISLPAIVSMASWSIIYHFRAITEERHLKKDPDYQTYTKKVKYRYIPRIY